MTGPKVAIVGSGFSGLAAASRLVSAGINVVVFEAGVRPGGKVFSERVDGFLVDHGADMFASQPGGALELCRRLGIEDRLISPREERRGAAIVRRGRPVNVPDGFVLVRATRLWPMLTTPLLSPWGKIRFLAERWIPSRTADGDSADVTDESIGDFVRRRMGREMLDRVVAPLAAGIYTGDVDRLGMNGSMRGFAEMERRHGSLAAATAARRKSGEDTRERNSAGARYNQFRSFPGGMGEFIDHLVSALPSGTIRTVMPVTRLERTTDDRLRVVADDHPAETFDRVLVTVPPPAAAKLLQPIAPEAAAGLTAIPSSSAAIVVLGVDDRQIVRPIDAFGFVVPPIERRRILAASFASYKFDGRAPAGKTLIRVFIGGVHDRDRLRESDDRLIQIAREELRDLIGLGGTPELARVIRWNDSMPQYQVGHDRIIRRIKNAIDAVPGLSLTNNAIGGVGIAPVITNATAVADSLVPVLR